MFWTELLCAVIMFFMVSSQRPRSTRSRRSQRQMISFGCCVCSKNKYSKLVRMKDIIKKRTLGAQIIVWTPIPIFPVPQSFVRVLACTKNIYKMLVRRKEFPKFVSNSESPDLVYFSFAFKFEFIFTPSSLLPCCHVSTTIIFLATLHLRELQ